MTVANQGYAQNAVTNTNELLNRYLPTKDGRAPAERLKAIAGRALADHRKRSTLTHDQAEEAFQHILEMGTHAALEYNQRLDKGTGTVPTDIRFGRFAYVRMRQRLIDWERKHIRDPRQRTPKPALVPYEDNDQTTPDFADLVASKDRIQRWDKAANHLGFDVTSWILTTLDDTAAIVLEDERPAA